MSSPPLSRDHPRRDLFVELLERTGHKNHNSSSRSNRPSTVPRRNLSSPPLSQDHPRRHLLVKSLSASSAKSLFSLCTSPTSDRTSRSQHSVRWGDEDSLFSANSFHTSSNHQLHGSSKHTTLTADATSVSSSCCSSLAVTSSDEKNTLFFFQASPLISKDRETLQPYSVDSLDIDSEQTVVRRSIQEVNPTVQVRFEVATTEAFGKFIALGQGRVLHFSCHGGNGSLGMDDGWGEMTPLDSKQIPDWVRNGRHRLEFVFVSACNSMEIGKAFIEAGVPHVVCCGEVATKTPNAVCCGAEDADSVDGGDSPKLDSRIRSDAAVEFEKAFYRACACEKSIQEAFDLACQEVLACSSIPQQDRAEQVQKFHLLPTDAPHEQSLFTRDASQLSLKSAPQMRRKYMSIFPDPPDVLLGRNVDVYNILKALRCGSRVVRIYGDTGIGKSTVIQACCQFLKARTHITQIGDIIWSPFDDDYDHELLFNISYILQSVRDEQLDANDFRKKCRSALNTVVRYLKTKTNLLVFNATSFTLEAIDRLSAVVQYLVDKTKSRIIIEMTKDGEEEFSHRRLPCLEMSLEIHRLDLKPSIYLFAKMCPHLDRSIRQLYELLVPMNEITRRSKRLLSIYEKIGGGYPETILRIAKDMTIEEYLELIALGHQKEMDLSFNSRAEIEFRLNELSTEMNCLIENTDFHKVHHLQNIYNETEALREQYPDHWQLEYRLCTLTEKLDQAIKDKEWLVAAEIRRQVDRTDFALKVEQASLLKLGLAKSAHEFELLKTRCSIDAKLVQLNSDLVQPMASNDFRRCREIENEVHRLQMIIPFRPTARELEEKLVQLQRDLRVSKSRKEWDRAEKIWEEVKQVETRLVLENEAQANLRRPNAQYENAIRVGAIAIAGVNLNSSSERPILQGFRNSPECLPRVQSSANNSVSKISFPPPTIAALVNGERLPIADPIPFEARRNNIDLALLDQHHLYPSQIEIEKQLDESSVAASNATNLSSIGSASMILDLKGGDENASTTYGHLEQQLSYEADSDDYESVATPSNGQGSSNPGNLIGALVEPSPAFLISLAVEHVPQPAPDLEDETEVFEGEERDEGRTSISTTVPPAPLEKKPSKWLFSSLCRKLSLKKKHT